MNIRKLRMSVMICIAMMISCISFSQINDPVPMPFNMGEHPAFSAMKAAYQAKDYSKAYNISVELIERYPLELAGYDYGYTCAHVLKNYKVASFFKNAAIGIEPMTPKMYADAISNAMYGKEDSNIQLYCNTLSFIPMDQATLQSINNYIEAHQSFSQYPDYAQVYTAFYNGMTAYKQSRNNNVAYFMKYIDPLFSIGNNALSANESVNLTNTLKTLKADAEKGYLPWPLYDYTLYAIGNKFQSTDPDMLKKMGAYLEERVVNNNTLALTRYLMFQPLHTFYKNESNYEKIISVCNIVQENLVQNTIAASLMADLQVYKVYAYAASGQHSVAISEAKQLASTLDKIKHPFSKLDAYQAIITGSAQDKFFQNKYIQEALTYGKTHDLTNERKYAAIQKFAENANTQNDAKKLETPLEFYNAAIEHVRSKQYDKAVPLLQSARRIQSQKIAQASNAEKKPLMPLYANIAAQLTGSLYESGKRDEIFDVIEAAKANNLAEITTNKSSERVKLQDLQALLKPDEAMIYYGDLNSGSIFSGTFMGMVVTKEHYHTRFIVSHGYLMKVYAALNNQIGIIENQLAANEFRRPTYTTYQNYEEAKLKPLLQGELRLLTEVYRRNINPSQEERNAGFGNNVTQMAQLFYSAYIQPLESAIAGKKRLIIAADAELNFLPFETFITNSGKYLVEEYNISYINSGTVLRNIRKQAASNYTKNIIAFGDAKYATLQTPGRKISSISDAETLKFDVEKSLQKKEPLDYAFASFGNEPPAYLLGTKKEVEMIQKEIPLSDVRLDADMTENEFKTMSAAGKLHNYKVIHIASHASVHPYVYNLSGIMFSTKPMPVNGEDGVLVINEVSDLNIKPELVMLSACQTALGKLMPGEGVMGLNQAFIAAGAKSTLTSLWPVNDYATSLFVQNFYKKVFIEKKSYIQACNEVKKDFIAGKFGEELKQPVYWAPFIYYGF